METRKAQQERGRGRPFISSSPYFSQVQNFTKSLEALRKPFKVAQKVQNEARHVSRSLDVPRKRNKALSLFMSAYVRNKKGLQGHASRLADEAEKILNNLTEKELDVKTERTYYARLKELLSALAHLARSKPAFMPFLLLVLWALELLEKLTQAYTVNTNREESPPPIRIRDVQAGALLTSAPPAVVLTNYRGTF